MDCKNDYYNRRACRRCHAQKLSCRPGTETECVRCIRANAECVPRPPLRIRKTENVLKHQEIHSHHSPIGNSDNNDTVWSTAKTSDFSASLRSNSNSRSNDLRGSSSEVRNLSNANQYSSVIPSSQWFPDMTISSLDFTNLTPSIGTGTTNSAHSVEAYTSSPAHLGSSELQFNSTDFASMLGLPKEDLASTDFNMTLADAVSTAEGTTSHTFCKSDWVEELARLNSRASKNNQDLSVHFQDFNAPKTSGSSSHSTDSGHASDSGSVFLDEILTLTKDLIGLLDKLAPHEEIATQDKNLESDEATFHNIFQKVPLNGPIQHPDCVMLSREMTIPNAISGDLFAILLFMSCYMVLLGTYKRLFARIHAIVAEEGPQVASPLLTHFRLPTVIVGPFTLRSTPKLEILLIMELVNFAIGRIGHAARQLTPTTVATPPDEEDLQQEGKASPLGSNSLDHIIASMLNAVQESEKELTETIRDIRGTLTQTRVGDNFAWFF